MSTVDLEQWVNKPAKVTFKNGNTFLDAIQRVQGTCYYSYAFNRRTYTRSGLYWISDPDHKWTIVSIEENLMTTTNLQKQIEETQKHLEALQQELKKQQNQERFNQEFFTPLNTPQNANACLTILKTKSSVSLKTAFSWSDTPQGYSHWKNIHDNCSTFNDADFDAIKTWIINYLIQLRSEGKMVFS